MKDTYYKASERSGVLGGFRCFRRRLPDCSKDRYGLALGFGGLRGFNGSGRAGPLGLGLWSVIQSCRLGS